MLNVYHFVYRQYGYEFKPNHKDLLWFEWLASTGRLVAYLKWRTANILARAVGSWDLVPCPFDFGKIPGLFDYYLREDRLGLLSTDQGFYRSRLHRRSDRFVRFCFSLYQSKSASLPAPSWEISQAVADTERRILADKEVEGSLMTPRGLLTEDILLRELDRTVDEVFPLLPERYSSRRQPGRGACIGSSRRDGGALGYTVRWLLRYDFLPYEFLECFFEGPGGAIACYSPLFAEDLDCVRSLQVRRSLSAQGVPCRPVGFPEPFKVRVVTLGETGVYSLARDYQPRIWSHLKNHPTFRLVGEALCPGIIRHFSSQLDPTRDPYLISGDYRQATDHIPSHLSERVLERILWRLGVPAEFWGVLLTSLTRHVLPSGGCQQSGQLMGSPSSFPVLCILNAAFSRLAYEWAHDRQEQFDLDDLPILVNGDDLLLGGDVSVFLTWKRVVGWAGLYPSVGKTLVSTKYGTINSNLYRIRWDAGFPSMDHRPHLQLQLALGSMKSGQYDFSGRIIGNGDPSTESRMWSDFMATAPNPVRAWRFLWGANRDYLMSLTRQYPGRSLVLPTDAGGMGFPMPPPDSEFFQSRLPRSYNLLLARMLLEEGTERQHSLRSQWLHLLSMSTDSAVENVVFREMSALQRRTLCPLLRRNAEEVEEVTVPPPSLFYRVATSSKEEGDPGGVRGERVRLFRRMLKEVKAFAASGRGPWTVAEVDRFLRESRWCRCYGRYSSRGFQYYEY